MKTMVTERGSAAKLQFSNSATGLLI